MTEEAEGYPTVEQFGEALEYEWDKLLALQTASDSFWRNAEAPKIITSMMWNWLNDDLAVRMTWAVAARRLLEYKWPATWKDAIKERWFPRWARHKRPVCYKKIELRELYACKRAPKDERVKYNLIERVLTDDLPNL